jgi:histidinol-phosphate/aromatic aminotransferase/cobyric acid decarboxylase-like protein
MSALGIGVSVALEQAHLADLRRHGDSEVRPGDSDHAVNVLAGGPPPWLSAAIAAADLSRYPDAVEATRAIAALHGRAPEEIVITNGAAEALWLLGPALRPRRVVLVQPGFSETEAALRAYAIPTEHSASCAAVPADADCVVLTNPTSPDGSLRDRADLLALRRPGRTVVIDEAFMSMVPGEPESLASVSLPDVIVVRSLTKLLSVAGLRVGYALAPAHLAERLISVRPPWSANALALQVLSTAAAHRDELAELADRVVVERRDLTHRLEQIPQLRVYPSWTNFVLVEAPDGPGLIDGLRARSIAVRPAATFPGFGVDHIRLTARDSVTNARLVAAIEAALEGLDLGRTAVSGP